MEVKWSTSTDSDGGGCRLYARRKGRPTRRRTASVWKTCAPIDDHARLARAEMHEPGSLRHGPTPVPRGGQSSPIVLVVTKRERFDRTVALSAPSGSNSTGVRPELKPTAPRLRRSNTATRQESTRSTPSSRFLECHGPEDSIHSAYRAPKAPASRRSGRPPRTYALLSGIEPPPGDPPPLSERRSGCRAENTPACALAVVPSSRGLPACSSPHLQDATPKSGSSSWSALNAERPLPRKGPFWCYMCSSH